MAVDDVNNNKTMLKNYKLILDIKVFKWIEVGMNEKIDYIILFQFNLYPYKYPLSNLSR